MNSKEFKSPFFTSVDSLMIDILENEIKNRQYEAKYPDLFIFRDRIIITFEKNGQRQKIHKLVYLMPKEQLKEFISIYNIHIKNEIDSEQIRKNFLNFKKTITSGIFPDVMKN